MNRMRLRHFCAVEDQGFTVTYERRDGRYLSVGFDFDEHHGRQPDRDSGKLADNGKVDFAHISFPECPYCGSRETLRCQHGLFICGGRSSAKQFVCRASCGAITKIKVRSSLEISCERADLALPPVHRPSLPKPALALPKPAPLIRYRK